MSTTIAVDPHTPASRRTTLDGVTQAAAAAERFGDGEAENAGLSQRFDTPAGEGAVSVDRGRVRADDLVDDPLERVPVVGHIHPFVK